MELIFKNALVFKKIFSGLKGFVSDINLEFTQTGLHCQSLDDSQIAVFILFIKKESFEKYEFNSNSSILIGLKIESLIDKVFGKCDKNDSLIIKYINDNNLVELTIKGHRQFTFKLKLIELDKELINIPEIEFVCELTLESSGLNDIINHMGKNGDFLQIKTTKDTIILQTDSDEGEGIYTLDSSDAKIDCDDNAKITVMLKYLIMFLKFHQLVDYVKIYIKEDQPVLFSFEMNIGYIQFYLAPSNT